MTALAPFHRRLRRRVLARRRLLAALAAATAVAGGLQAVAAPPPPTRSVLTAARDLPGGSVLAPSDLRRVAFAPDSVPAGVVGRAAEVVGRTTAAPLRAGEPVTDVSLVSGAMLEGHPGTVAAPVRIGDPEAVRLLRVGDRVDVLAADPRGEQETVVVAEGAPVVALPAGEEAVAGGPGGGLMVLAVPEATGRALAGAGVTHYLSVVITH
jgi:Flp pilus assembly protein CpaB